MGYQSATSSEQYMLNGLFIHQKGPRRFEKNQGATSGHVLTVWPGAPNSPSHPDKYGGFHKWRYPQMDGLEGKIS